MKTSFRQIVCSWSKFVFLHYFLLFKPKKNWLKISTILKIIYLVSKLLRYLVGSRVCMKWALLRNTPKVFTQKLSMLLVILLVLTWRNLQSRFPKRKQGVCRPTLALSFTLRQKKNYENSNISPCTKIIFKKSSKKSQNPSKYYYNSITTKLKFQHKPKYHLSNILI